MPDQDEFAQLSDELLVYGLANGAEELKRRVHGYRDRVQMLERGLGEAVSELRLVVKAWGECAPGELEHVVDVRACFEALADKLEALRG